MLWSGNGKTRKILIFPQNSKEIDNMKKEKKIVFDKEEIELIQHVLQERHFRPLDKGMDIARSILNKLKD